MQISKYCTVPVLSTVVPRSVNSSLRELVQAKKLFSEGKKPSLKKLVAMTMKAKEPDEISSRIAAMGSLLSFQHKNLEEAERCLSKASLTPAVIQNTLKIFILAEKGQINEALDVLDNVLNIEHTLFNTDNFSITDEALDYLHKKITSTENTTDQMRRFRKLQKAVSSYNCRSSKKMEDLLQTSITTEFLIDDRRIKHNVINDQIIRETPQFLTKQN